MKIMNIPAEEVQVGDEIRTANGFIGVREIHSVQESEAGFVEAKDPEKTKVGLLTPRGMFGVAPDQKITVRRRTTQGKYSW